MSGVREGVSAKMVTGAGWVKGWGEGLSVSCVEGVRWGKGKGVVG